MKQVYSDLSMVLEGGFVQTAQDCASSCVVFGAPALVSGVPELQICCGQTSSVQGIYMMDASGLLVSANSSLIVVSHPMPPPRSTLYCL